MNRLRIGFGGHWHTLRPVLFQNLLGVQEAPPEMPWQGTVDDPVLGEVPLVGQLQVPEGARSLVVLVHGLGGCFDSAYMLRSAHAARRLGLATLRLNLRGSGQAGVDLHHAGLSEDFEHVLKSPALASFERIAVLGFSLGGHLALRYGTHAEDPRLRAVAAVGAPVAPSLTVRDFDRPSNWVYRGYILGNLRRIIADLEGVHPAYGAEDLRRVRSLRQFDSLTIVPRFGFRDVDDYYDTAAVCNRWQDLRLPALLVAAEGDPIVTARSIRAGLDGAPKGLDVRFLETGGHIAFPEGLHLGEDVPPGLESQVLGWLARRLE
jgi:hypothetical protein